MYIYIYIYICIYIGIVTYRMCAGGEDVEQPTRRYAAGARRIMGLVSPYVRGSHAGGLVGMIMYHLYM